MGKSKQESSGLKGTKNGRGGVKEDTSEGVDGR